ncbi:MAG: CBS domain-containing protein [Bacteroidales bacterium]
MLAKHLLSKTIVPLRTSDTGISALSMMDEFKVAHLPIVNNVDFLGLVSEDDILNFNDPGKPLGEHSLSLKKPYITEDQHVYDIIKIIYEQKLTVVPVLDKINTYKGTVVMSELVSRLAEMASIQQPGAIIVLELNEKDYLLSEIVQIIESNDTKILSLYTSSPVDSTRLELTIKLNKMDISSVLATFSRYNYTIKASYSENEYWDDLMDRYNSLINYLNI